MPSNNSTEDVSHPPETITSRSDAKSSSTWKLEESSIWWLSYFVEPGNSTGWLSNPGNILLLTSVPFFAGAYFGYRMPTERLEDLIQGSVGDADNSSQKGPQTPGKRTRASAKTVDQDAVRVVAARTASKALRIATLGTIGTFGFLGAIGFYMSGYKTLKEAVEGTTRRASSWGKSLEHAMGGDQATSKTHPEVLATKHMEGDEELRYIYDKYIKEGDNDKDELWGDDGDRQTERDASPTLYSIYEKYFIKKEND